MNKYRLGLVVGKFYPPHAGHHLLINRAAAACTKVIVIVAPSSVESIPLEQRLAWLREVHGGQLHVRFVGRYDDLPVDFDDQSTLDAHLTLLRECLGDAEVDAVFTSEDWGQALADQFDAQHVSFQRDSQTASVSGTTVRADPIGHWDVLAPCVRSWFVRKVVVIGAESTGSTTLVKALAERFQQRAGVWSRTRWVPHYGRELAESKLAEAKTRDRSATGRDIDWTRADFLEMVREQNGAEDAAIGLGSPLLICDSDAFAVRLWEERQLGSSSPEVRAAGRTPDLYLLTDHVGVRFQEDGVRAGDGQRPETTDRYRQLLAEQPAPVVELRGPHQKRLLKAEAAIDEILAQGWQLAPPMERPPVPTQPTANFG
ncbi:transcriptional regulator [Pseudonocardiaceae bacterium YIM PH 21723]|nr:transcriptional regulator [Pseudonocardiaceae bacterium YIM PH 21723]